VITQGKTEPRLAYLLRVAVAFAEKYPDGTIDYDETTCDGFCLADDLRGEVDGLIAMENELADMAKQRDELAARFTRLDEPRYSGKPMLDLVLSVRNPEFDAWVASLPPTYWARYDLSAVRIGWEAATKGGSHE
jgi:hypothetical protein